MTRSIHGRCDGIRRRVDELLATTAEEDAAAGLLDHDLVRQVEHAAAVDAAGRRPPFTFHHRARAHAAQLEPPASEPDADGDDEVLLG